MGHSENDNFIIGKDDLILVTGATGFIGSRLVRHLLDRGFRNLRCFVRPFSKMARIQALCGPAATEHEWNCSKEIYCRARIAPLRRRTSRSFFTWLQARAKSPFPTLS